MPAALSLKPSLIFPPFLAALSAETLFPPQKPYFLDGVPHLSLFETWGFSALLIYGPSLSTYGRQPNHCHPERVRSPDESRDLQFFFDQSLPVRALHAPSTNYLFPPPPNKILSFRGAVRPPQRAATRNLLFSTNGHSGGHSPPGRATSSPPPHP